jgi:hypothetical protein
VKLVLQSGIAPDPSSASGYTTHWSPVGQPLEAIYKEIIRQNGIELERKLAAVSDGTALPEPAPARLHPADIDAIAEAVVARLVPRREAEPECVRCWTCGGKGYLGRGRYVGDQCTVCEGTGQTS